MTVYVRRTIGLASALSALAGYIDAIGFISLGGFFVSFMTGNSTRFGIEIARGNLMGIAISGGLLATFVVGVVIGALIAKAAGHWRRAAVLGWVTICLATAALFDNLGNLAVSTGALVLAMAAANSVFQRNGEVTIGVTYMTGTLVKMGQQIANALTGGPKLAWLRNFTIWFGLALGSVAGAVAYDAVGSLAIWLSAGVSAVLALGSLSIPAHID
ncbi:YoaK family protein [Bosea sp. PAMC 26642]|uniref:YoaK family protein n=1 Tax=Bosea sp. (strain PAMC 26642) TaxID=1792307 RepID=UPI00076FEAAE|nr:YoaK family protein [Bosea sp. PAMC 26642]AMJ60577.1 hypothetical protein AXW83_09995 [Bosea sp. PAMC 26642]